MKIALDFDGRNYTRDGHEIDVDDCRERRGALCNKHEEEEDGFDFLLDCESAQGESVASGTLYQTAVFYPSMLPIDEDY